MLKQKEIIANKLAHLEKMRGYLAYSSGRMLKAKITEKNLQRLSDEDAEMLSLVEPVMAMHRRAEQYCRMKLGVKTVVVGDGEP